MKRSEINQYTTPGEELSNEICGFDEIRNKFVIEKAGVMEKNLK